MDTKRFHQPGYKNQIRAVRNYRRTAPPLPTGKFGRFLAFSGLGTSMRKIAALLFIMLAVYAVYFAQLFDLKNIEVLGGDSALAAQIRTDFEHYKKSYYFLLPQKNYLTFNAANFNNYLLKNNPRVSRVLSIEKHLLKGVKISVFPRVPSLVLQINEQAYVLNSDGTLAAAPAEDPGLLLITDLQNERATAGDVFFPEKTNNFIQYLLENFEKQLPLKIKQLQFTGKASQEISFITTAGGKFIFSTDTDPKLYLQRLHTLWNQLDPKQRSKISYVDLRFKNNAYVCYQAEQCATVADVNLKPLNEKNERK